MPMPWGWRPRHGDPPPRLWTRWYRLPERASFAVFESLAGQGSGGELSGGRERWSSISAERRKGPQYRRLQLPFVAVSAIAANPLLRCGTETQLSDLNTLSPSIRALRGVGTARGGIEPRERSGFWSWGEGGRPPASTSWGPDDRGRVSSPTHSERIMDRGKGVLQNVLVGRLPSQVPLRALDPFGSLAPSP